MKDKKPKSKNHWGEKNPSVSTT